MERLGICIGALAAVIAAIVSLASCASLQRSQDEGDAKRIANLINAGNAQSLAGMSASPFLVDQEIVVLPADVSGFWQNAIAAGFRVDGAALERAAPVTAASYTEFAGTMEVKSFFAQYLKDGARILELSTGAGRRVLLLTRKAWFTLKIHGFKGPF